MNREQRTFVRVRRLEQIGGEAVLTAFCPRKEHTVDLLGCLDCKHRIALSLDAAEGHGTLQCRTVAPDDPPRTTWPMRPTDAERTPVSEIMPVQTALVRPDMDLDSVTHVLLERGLNAVPVVDEQGIAIGILSKTDLLRHQQAEAGAYEPPPELTGTGFEDECGVHVERPSAAKVADAMTPVAFTLPETASIARAAALMTFEHVQQVPITGPEQTVVGMIGSADILRWLARRAGYVMAPS
jgi:CBS-domain-containing membrane protein